MMMLWAILLLLYVMPMQATTVEASDASSPEESLADTEGAAARANAAWSATLEAEFERVRTSLPKLDFDAAKALLQEAKAASVAHLGPRLVPLGHWLGAAVRDAPLLRRAPAPGPLRAGGARFGFPFESPQFPFDYPSTRPATRRESRRAAPRPTRGRESGVNHESSINSEFDTPVYLILIANPCLSVEIAFHSIG